MKILFLHGLGSTVGGVKPTYLAQHGHTVLNLLLANDDFDDAVRITQAEFDRHHPDMVIGSSRGGAVAINLKINAPLFLRRTLMRWGMATEIT
jgi:homoserine acetyltransferase